MTEPLAPTAWLLDLDGTLYRPALVKLVMAAELASMGATNVKVLRLFRRAHETMREDLRKSPQVEFQPNPFEHQLRLTAERAGTTPDHVRSVVEEWMFSRPCKWLRRTRRSSLIGQLEQFVSGGGRAAVVSDYPAEKKLEALDVRRWLSAVVASGEHPALKRLKPCPDGYLLAAEELGVAPERCLVIGDRKDADGAAARQANMQFRLIR